MSTRPLERAAGGRAPGGGNPIVARSLTLRYGDKTAFRDVHLDVPRRRISAIVGPSGCGKSSLLACMNRLVDLVPGARIEGRLEVCGQDALAANLDVAELRRRVGMIFQRPNPFATSIRRNLEMPLRDHGVGDAARRAWIIEKRLRDVGLWEEVRDRLDAPAQSLSGGQQQRLCIARALALEPDVLLLDEPCSALDPIATRVIEELLVALRERVTLVVVTHNLGQAHRIADELAVFWYVDGAGRLIDAGPATRVFEQPAHPLAAAYLAGRQG